MSSGCKLDRPPRCIGSSSDSTLRRKRRAAAHTLASATKPPSMAKRMAERTVVAVKELRGRPTVIFLRPRWRAPVKIGAGTLQPNNLQAVRRRITYFFEGRTVLEGGGPRPDRSRRYGKVGPLWLRPLTEPAEGPQGRR